MAQFKVEIRTIESVETHPNADRLDIARVAGLGYQFCVGRGEYQPGDRVVYFPIDSVLPPDLADRLGLRPFLSGVDKDRIRTVTLRGKISQGLVRKPAECLPAGAPILPDGDVTSLLGVTKYVAPENVTAEGILLPLPDGLGLYDIESADCFLMIAERLMDKPVQITEKLEGDNMTVAYLEDGKVAICCHGSRIVEFAEDDPRRGKPSKYHMAAFQCGMVNVLDSFSRSMVAHGIGLVALRGELIGPGTRKNIYRLPRPEIRLFDAKLDGTYLNAKPFEELFAPQNRVPVIASGGILRDWLAGRTLQEASNGMSLLNPKVRREGVVIKPMVEESIDFGDGCLQRLILKQRSPEYLAKEGD